MTEYDKMIAGESYNPLDKTLIKMRFHAQILCEDFNATSIRKLGTRKKLLKQLFAACGNNIYIEPSFKCDYGQNISVGENFYANYHCVILDAAKVTIGDNCFIAPQVGIYTATHPIDAEQRATGIESARPVTIGNNCWIGGGAVINPGVTLGNNVVVGSGAVVTKSFADNLVIAGNPAKIIKHL
ncbi:sugar O-acetyltransferase [Gayadomonas joobiniege]|uniref:sugar O-acetyltransferase n=1 Tax=Gayadomonas joobiniege TaxID=1234606 RepID=UPI00036E1A6C|nr:sugar O-acetyltransferase [Gayadomonas joobiniege]